MNKLDVSPPTLTVSPASFSELQPVRRLIVLVPESEVDSALTARKIWELANALESRVQFLGLSKDAEHEPSISMDRGSWPKMVNPGSLNRSLPAQLQ